MEFKSCKKYPIAKFFAISTFTRVEKTHQKYKTEKFVPLNNKELAFNKARSAKQHNGV